MKNLSKILSWLFFFSIIYVITFSSVVFAESNTSLKSTKNRLVTIFKQNSKAINLTEALILVSKDWDSSLDEKSLKQEIEQLVALVKNKLTKQSTAQDIVNILKQTIHQEKGYRYTDQVDERGIPVNKDELFLHGMLKSKLGYCMNLSLLYLIIGNELNLPLYGVALPNHFFVRYDSGNDQINIESTEMGASYPDSFYENRFDIKFDAKTPFFTQSLNKKQSLGAYLSNVGMVYHKNARPQKS
ncbi:uncharacterized protein METZ01_LOCUS253554, partial [marine metagenome]